MEVHNYALCEEILKENESFQKNDYLTNLKREKHQKDDQQNKKSNFKLDIIGFNVYIEYEKNITE